MLEIGSSLGDEVAAVFMREDPSRRTEINFYRVDTSRESSVSQTGEFSGRCRYKRYQASSVPRGDFLTEEQLSRLYVTNLSMTNQQPLARVLERLESDKKTIKDSGISESGIEIVKTDNRISDFDVVVIDGARFSAVADLQSLRGSTHIFITNVSELVGSKVYETLKIDPGYSLESEHWNGGTTYASFRRKQLSPQAQLPIHFFTIVLNGMPFIRHHVEVFSRLSVPWTWHIVEGVASLSHDTAWSLENGGRISETLHHNGLSNDGTTEYLNELVEKYPGQVKVYRKTGGEFWNGKREMVNAPLASINEQALLVQVDSDELWSIEQLERLSLAFQERPDKTAAYFFCNYFVGPELIISTRNTYGNNSSYEWLRAWRYLPGSRWQAHEPPRLLAPLGDGRAVDLAQVNPFTHAETESMGLVFQHYAYVTEEQARFKESYYGYADAVARWRRLQTSSHFPVALASYLPWVKDQAQVTTIASTRIQALARRTLDGTWRFASSSARVSPAREIMLVRTDMIGDAVLFSSLLPGIRELYPESSISIVCQDTVAPIWENHPLINRVISFNRATVSTDPSALEGFLARLRGLKPDVAINSAWSADALSHVLTISSGAPVRVCLSGDSVNIDPAKRSRALELYSLVAKSSPQSTLEINRYRDLLIAMGGRAATLTPVYNLLSVEIKDAQNTIQGLGLSTGRLLVVVPQAAGGIPHREYPLIAEVVPEVARLMGLDVLVLGTPKDLVIADAIVRGVGVRARSLVGKTSIRQAAALIAQASCALGVDTGLMHLAAAQDIPSVVIIGGGNFGRFFPYGRRTRIITNHLECFGCNWVCGLPEPLCTRGIASQDVVKMVCSLCRECGLEAQPRPIEQEISAALSLLEA